MADCVKETCCTSCIHKNVCMFKKDLLNVYDSILKVNVLVKNENNNDNEKVRIKKAIDFDFISEISVLCKYYNFEKIEKGIN